MKKSICFVLLAGIISMSSAQTMLSLDSCRALALRNNKELKIAQEKIKAAHYEKKAAFTNYLPNFSATGTYMRNQREVSLLSNEQKEGLSTMGSTLQPQFQATMQQIADANPDLGQLLAPLAALDIASPLNAMGTSLTDALRTDTRNMYAGAVTLTQPIYMGGKIRAYNKITNYAEKLSMAQHETNVQEVILSTDEAYWQVISLVHKKQLAESFLQLVQKLDSDIEKMIREGVATKADGLSVKVKVNEAEMTLTKVNDGLSLAKMVLCQLCGIDITTPIQLTDENLENLPMPYTNVEKHVETAYENRPEIRGLELATDIYKQKVNVVRSEYLPSIALLGNYIVSNPSVMNGFEKKFKGMWNVGVMVSIPIFHWGEGSYKVKAAKADARAAQLQLDEVKEKIELQVNQSSFKVNEAAKKLAMAEKNLDKADENLRYANLGFREGVIPTSNVLEAQTAWLSAQSEKIDAQIDVKLTDVYLKKSLGILR